MALRPVVPNVPRGNRGYGPTGRGKENVCPDGSPPGPGGCDRGRDQRGDASVLHHNWKDKKEPCGDLVKDGSAILKELCDRIKACDEANAALKAEIDNKEDEKGRLVDELRATNNRNTALGVTLDSQAEEIETLKKKAATAIKQSARDREAGQNMAKAMVDLEEEMEDLTKKVKLLEPQKKELLEAAKELTVELTHAREQKAQLKAELGRSEEENETLKDKLKDKDRNLDDLRTALGAKDQELENLQNAFDNSDVGKERTRRLLAEEILLTIVLFPFLQNKRAGININELLLPYYKGGADIPLDLAQAYLTKMGLRYALMEVGSKNYIPWKTHANDGFTVFNRMKIPNIREEGYEKTITMAAVYKRLNDMKEDVVAYSNYTDLDNVFNAALPDRNIQWLEQSYSLRDPQPRVSHEVKNRDEGGSRRTQIGKPRLHSTTGLTPNRTCNWRASQATAAHLFEEI
jgi:hypothetical protein